MLPETFTVKDIEKLGKDRAFTEGFTLDLSSDCSDCMIVTALSRYYGKEAPTICFFLVEKEKECFLYRSHSYAMGREGEWTRQQWRVPPMWHPSLIARIRVEIPKGTRLCLSDFHNHYENGARPWLESGPRHNAHLGFLGAAPSKSRRAVELAAQCGFSSCIVNPKETLDGHLVCWHDSTINKLAMNEKGERIWDNSDYPPLKISQMTLEELRKWELGAYRHPLFADSHVLLMEDAFRIMAKTGIYPMFSTHPAPSDAAWEKVKDMLLRYGLTGRFHVKSFKLPILEKAYSVFGDTIDGYTWDNGNVEEFKASSLYGANCRLGIELNKADMTKEKAREILDAGFFAAVYGLKEQVCYREIEELMSWGITEFTEDHHCSMGLNW